MSGYEVVRWTLDHLRTGDHFTFPINPNQMEPVFRTYGRHANADGSTWTPPRAPREWAFSGVLYEQTDRDEMERWVREYGGERVLLTDHLSQQITVRLKSFEPSWRPASFHRPNSWKYTMRGLVMGGVEMLDPPGDPDALPVADTTPPTDPGAPSATSVSDVSITLTWTLSTDDVAVGQYIIYRDGDPIDLIEAPPYVDTDLEPDTPYSYEIQAIDTSGNQSDLSPATVITTEATP